MQDCKQYFTRKVFRQARHHLWSIWYLLTDWNHSRRLLRAAKQFGFPNTISLPAGRVIIVRNEHDPWLTDDLGPLQQAHPSIQLVSLPGDHDDCWFNPEPYVNLLQSERNEHHA